MENRIFNLEILKFSEKENEYPLRRILVDNYDQDKLDELNKEIFRKFSLIQKWGCY